MNNLKKITTLILLIWVSFSFAQDCNQYFPLQEGIAFEHTNYNPKGKVESYSDHEVVKVSDIANGTEVNMKAIIKDDKSNGISSMDYILRCENGNLLIDLESLVPTAQFAQYKGMDMKISEGFSNFPADPKVGDKLEDATISIEISSSGMVVMTMQVFITDRNITKSEEVTTPSGTYDCLVITQNTTVKIGGMMPMTRNSSSIEWISKGFGMVKSESYDKKGKLESYTLLTKYSK